MQLSEVEESVFRLSEGKEESQKMGEKAAEEVA
jgi:hypothetical protein